MTMIISGEAFSTMLRINQTRLEESKKHFEDLLKNTALSSEKKKEIAVKLATITCLPIEIST